MMSACRFVVITAVLTGLGGAGSFLLAQEYTKLTPAQLPDAHSRLSAQNAPFILRPHDESVHTLPATHWASPVHAVKQRAPLQVNGAHALASGATQAPVSLQVEGGV